MLVTHCFSRVRSIFLAFIGLFRRALCCFSRRRRNSFSDHEQLETVNVVSNSSPSKYKNVPERDWNSWDDSPRTVEEHIEAYRQKLVQPPPAPESKPEEVMNFFEDMTPKIIKQKKVLIRTDSGGGSGSSDPSFTRLEATSDIPVIADLEDWEDNEETGWDEISDSNTKQLIREKRKELRAQRQQQQKNKTGHSSERLGSKYS